LILLPCFVLIEAIKNGGGNSRLLDDLLARLRVNIEGIMIVVDGYFMVHAFAYANIYIVPFVIFW
jgi:hypothetical protein